MFVSEDEISKQKMFTYYFFLEKLHNYFENL